MKLKKPSLIVCITLTLLAAVAVAGVAVGTTPTKLKKNAYGSISFADGQLSAQGDGFTVTRQGVGLYTITYDKPFAQTPRLVIDPVQKSIDLTLQEWSADADAPTNPFDSGCIVTAHSPTGATIACAALDPTSE